MVKQVPFKSIFSTTLLLLLVGSCSVNNEYAIRDIKDINTEMTLFSDGLDIPVGNLKPILMDSILSLLDINLIEKSGDSYVIRQKGKLSLDEQLKSTGISKLRAIDRLDGAGFSFFASIPGFPSSCVGTDGELSLPFVSTQEVTIVSAQDIPGEIKYVKEMTLKDSDLILQASFKGLPWFGDGNPFKLDAVVSLPGFISPSSIDLKGTVDSKGRLLFEDGSYFKTVRIEKVSDLKINPDKGIFGTFYVSGKLSAEVPEQGVTPFSESIDCSVSVSLGDGNGKIGIDRAVVLADYRMPAHFKVSFDDVPEKLKAADVVLDLAAPQLMMDISTNLGLPFCATMTITPWRNGMALDERAVAIRDLSIPCSSSAEKVSQSHLYISDSMSGIPSNDYAFIQANTAPLLRQIPDSLVIDMDAGIRNGADCVVEPFAEYNAGIDYTIQIPLVTGEDLNLNFDSDFDLDLGEISEKVGAVALGITGKVRNDSPLAIEALLSLHDKDGNPILPDNEIRPVLVGADCESDLDFFADLSSGDKLAQVSKGRIALHVCSAGGPICPSQSILIHSLKAHLPKGVTIRTQK